MNIRIKDREIDIMFDDLDKDVQKEFLKAVKCESASDGNYDVIPIAVIPIPED